MDTVFERLDSAARVRGEPSLARIVSRWVLMVAPSLLHGSHWPQLSTARKWAMPAATATRSVRSSNTRKPAEPIPEPIVRISS